MAMIGDSFELDPKLLRQDANCDGPHLRVVITEPDKQGKVLVVNLTSWHPRYEQTCVFNGGEHKWIKHKSVVKYGEARCWDVEKIDAALRTGQLVSHPPVSMDVLKKIQVGALRSEFLPPYVLPLIKVFDPRAKPAVGLPPKGPGHPAT